MRPFKKILVAALRKTTAAWPLAFYHSSHSSKTELLDKIHWDGMICNVLL